VPGCGFIRGDFTEKDIRVQINDFFKMERVDTVLKIK
jgi:hypothetical protein